MHCLSTMLRPFASQQDSTLLFCFLFFSFDFSASQPLSARRPPLTTRPGPKQQRRQPPSRSAATHTHIFMSSPSCQCAQNCQTPLKALDAMCNSFNTRPRRYPSHCCNGRAHATLHPASSREAAGNSFNLFKSTPQWIRERVVSRRPDTQQPSSFGGDLRVVCDSITGRENIIHDFLSAARGSTHVGRGEKRLDRNCGVQN